MRPGPKPSGPRSRQSHTVSVSAVGPVYAEAREVTTRCVGVAPASPPDSEFVGCRVAERVRLRDGTDALIRPLLPTDRELLRQEYELLSPRSRFHRFLGGDPTPDRRHAGPFRRRGRRDRPRRLRPAGDNVASFAMLHRLGDTELKRSGSGCTQVVVQLRHDAAGGSRTTARPEDG